MLKYETLIYNINGIMELYLIGSEINIEKSEIHEVYRS